jgi:hypothetical protein
MYVSAMILIVKIFLLFILPITPHAIEDWYIANNIVSGQGYSLSLGPTALKTPVYPLFLIPFALFGDLGLSFASATQHIMWFFAALAFMRACSLRFGEKFSTLSGFIFALHPAYLYYPFVIESTTLTVPLMIFYWYGCEFYRKQNHHQYWLMILGFIIGLCQPILLPAIFAMQLLYARPLSKKTLLALCISAFIVFAPWSLRNALTFQKFIPMKSPMWMNIYEGMAPTLSQSDIAFIENARKTHNDVQMEQFYKKVVSKRINQSPDTYARECLHRVKEFWLIPDRYSDRIFESGILISRIIHQATLLIASLIAILLLIFRSEAFSEQAPLLWIMAGTLIYVSLIYALTQAANIRFKLDVEWLQIVLLFPIFKVLRSKPKKKGTFLT